MQNNRPGFVFEVAVGAIILIGVALAVLLFMFYRSSTTEVAPAYSASVAESAQEIKKKNLNSYLDKMEHYEDKVIDEDSRKSSKKKDRANVIARGTELSENSVVAIIDRIVDDALNKIP